MHKDIHFNNDLFYSKLLDPSGCEEHGKAGSCTPRQALVFAQEGLGKLASEAQKPLFAPDVDK
jgi:hypothetical protein